MSAPSVRYWVFNYKPEWEAVSKEIVSLRQGLAEEIDGSTVSLNTTDRRLRLRGREQRFPLPHSLPLLPLLGLQRSRADVNHLFASAGERWLTPFLAGPRAILTIAKDSNSYRRVERNAGTFLRYRTIVVQCERDRDLMRQFGVPEASIRLIRPGIAPSAYREGQGPFTILFASSPLTAEHFLSRGIYLMIRVAARMPDVRFLLVWRRRHLAKLQRLLAETGAANVEVMNGQVRDMAAVYDRVHATVLPALEHRSFIPCPRSGLESLAHGKPLLASHFVAIAGSVSRAGAGVTFEPTVAGLEGAIRELRTSYTRLQGCTQPYVQRYFSPTVHLELYRRLYQAVAG